MAIFEQLLCLFIAAIVLAAAARRFGAPFPVFLAVGGVGIALLPGVPTFTLPPELALALFVAPVLLDSAYDMSLRDLRENWAPIAGLVVVAVTLTTACVAMVVHMLVPAMPWAATASGGGRTGRHRGAAGCRRRHLGPAPAESAAPHHDDPRR
jgi:NhaP-type Na+/H+ or K+/H+ antiporter